MRTSLVIACLLIARSALAQSLPLCDDGMGGHTPCTSIDAAFLPTIPAAKLPIVPITKGGTGINSSGMPYGRYFAGGASGIPGFIFPDRRHIPGVVVDLTTTPAPPIEITKAPGGIVELLRFPARSGTQNRIYSDQDAIYLAFNAKPGPVPTWDKETTASTSSVFAFRHDGTVRFMADADPAISRWSTAAPQYQIRNQAGGWVTTKGQQTAIAGGTICGGAAGDIHPFPVQWPLPYETAPITVGAGADIASSGTNVASVNGVTRHGAVLNIRNTSGARCVTWIGYVTASN